MRSFVFAILFFLIACQSVPENISERSPAQSRTEFTGKQDFNQQREEIILEHKYYKVSYDSEHRLPKWVEYTLTKGDLAVSVGKRANKFRPDPLLKKMGYEGVKKDEIPGALYDRGHMAPADDFKRSQDALDETFYTSNIAPQKAALNQSAWLRLESMVQKWACGENEITVITGPVLSPGLPKINGTGISIPDKFFKAVYARSRDKKSKGGKSICFLYGQTDDRTVEPRDRVMSVSECEKSIGFDIGPRDLQFTENKYDLKDWKTGRCGT